MGIENSIWGKSKMAPGSPRNPESILKKVPLTKIRVWESPFWRQKASKKGRKKFNSS